MVCTYVRAPQLGHQRTFQQIACNHKQKQKFTRVRVFNILNAIRQLCTHGKTTDREHDLQTTT